MMHEFEHRIPPLSPTICAQLHRFVATLSPVECDELHRVQAEGDLGLIAASLCAKAKYFAGQLTDAEPAA